MKLNCTHIFQLLPILIKFLFWKLQFQVLPTGYVPIVSLLDPPKLSLSSLISLSNSLKSAFLLLIYQAISLSHMSTLHETLVSYLVKISFMLNKYLLFQNRDSSMFGISGAYDIWLITPIAFTLATSLIHGKTDYCNSLLLNLLATQINSFQLVFNYAARDVTRSPNFHDITPIIKSFHWLTIN